MSESKIQVNFTTILQLKKEVQNAYEMFTKTYQAELIYIEKKIQRDTHRENSIQSCCGFIPFSSSSTNAKKAAYKYYCKYSPQFCALFKQMTLQQKQQYFYELLTFIKELKSLCETYITKSQNNLRSEINCNKLKQKLMSKLMQKFVNRQIVQQFDQKIGSQYFEVKVQSDTHCYQKVGRLCKFKLYLMHKQNDQDAKEVIDIRNYLILQTQTKKQKHSLFLQAIYEMVVPIKLRLTFLKAKDSQKYIPTLREIVQIGKIQKLIDNIKMGKIDSKQAAVHVDNSDVIRHSFMQTNDDISDNEEDPQDNLVGIEILFQRKSFKSDLRLQKKMTIRKQKQEQIKKMLIETLHYLLEKKEKQNQRINQFLQRQIIINQRNRSEATDRLLIRSQNCLVVPSKKELPTQKQIIREIVEQTELEKQNCLQIINNYSKMHETRKRRDSFVNDDDQLQYNHSKYQLMKKKKSQKIKYYKNVFVEMYPEYNLQDLFNLLGMERQHITEQVYNLPKKIITKEEGSLKEQKAAKLKQMWLDRLNYSCKLFLKRNSPNFIKISFTLNVQIKSLMQALANVEAYSYWHDNVVKVTILSVISSENIITYQLECVDSEGGHYSYTILMHVFKVENKYFILQKSIELIEDGENNKNNILDLGYFKKQKTKKHKFKFILLRAITTEKNGFSEILIDAELDQFTNKNEKIKREDISFLLNFNLLPSYWQMQQCTSFSQQRLNLEWLVPSGPLSPHDQEENLDFGNMMDQSPLEKMQSQLDIDIISSSENLASTSNYYDI